MPDSSPPSRHRLTLSPAALNFDDNTPAAHARRVQVVRPLPPSAPYGALDWSLLVNAGPDAARMAAVGATRRHRLLSWTRVIGVLIVGLLAAYAGHTYRVARLSYCDNGVAPINAWWPGAGGAPQCVRWTPAPILTDVAAGPMSLARDPAECQPCPGGATCTDGLAKCDDPMKTVQNGQCRENKDLVRRVTKATEAISAALTHDAGASQSAVRVVAALDECNSLWLFGWVRMVAGSRYCNEVDVPVDEVYVSYTTNQLLKLLQSRGYSIAVRGCMEVTTALRLLTLRRSGGTWAWTPQPKDAVTALKNVQNNRATTVPVDVHKPAYVPWPALLSPI